MSESAILRYLDAIQRGQERVEAKVLELAESLAGCQAKHAGERGLSLRRKGAIVKIFVGLAVAVAGALADRLTNR